MIRLTELQMTIDGAPAAITRDALPAPVVVGESIAIEWTRPTVLMSSAATTLQFEMIRPAWSKIPAPALDARVELTAMITSDGLGAGVHPVEQSRQVIFTGWIDGVTEHPRERGDELRGWTRFSITATCAIGLLARTKIGQPPWPRETPSARMMRIYAIVPEAFSSAPNTWGTLMPGGELVERDVDSTPAMEVLEACIDPSLNRFGLDSSGLLRLVPAPWFSTQGEAGDFIYSSGSGWETTAADLPIGAARITPSVDRSRAWGTGISTVTVSHYIRGNDVYPEARAASAQRSITYGSSTAAGQALTISSDRITATSVQDPAALDTVPFTPSPGMTELALRLLAATTDNLPAVAPLRWDLEHLDSIADGPVLYMLPEGVGRFPLVRLVGVELGVPIAHLVSGGRLELSVTGPQTLEVQLQPVQMVGYSLLTFGDLLASPQVQIGNNVGNRDNRIHHLATTTRVETGV